MRQFLLLALAAATLTATAADLKTVAKRSESGLIQPAASAKTFKAKYHVDDLQKTGASDMSRILSAAPNGMNRLTSEMITDPQGSTSRYAMAADIYLSTMGSTHVGGFGAKAVTSDDGTAFYSRAFTLNFFQQGYTKGNIDGDKIVIDGGQYVYNTDKDEKAYMYAAHLNEGEDWPEFVDTFTLTKDEKGRYVSAPGEYLIVMTQEEAEMGINEGSNIICFGFNYVFTPLPADLTESKMPADAETFTYQMMANSLKAEGAMATKDVTVGFKDDKVYIGGLSDYLPGTYFTGTKNDDNTYTFKTHQYIGYYDEGDYPYIHEFALVDPLYFDGESLGYVETDELTMTVNDARTMMSFPETAGVFVNFYGDLASWDEVYWNIKIGDFNTPLTPTEVTGLTCYSSYDQPYTVFEWSNISKEGVMMLGSNLWCEFIINGETYTFNPEDYEGLTEPTQRIYYDTTGIEGMYPGEYSTIYLKGFDNRGQEIKTFAVKVGFEGKDEVRYSDIVYAAGMEPFEDKAFVPSTPSNVFIYNDYNNKIHFKLDGKDTEGNVIPARLLAVEILLDGEPLPFKDSDYYFGDGTGEDVTMLGLAENAINYSSGSGIVTKYGDEYLFSLWGHDEIPEFTTLAIRPVCTGGDTFTYGKTCEVVLDRQATPIAPANVSYDNDSRTLKFDAFPVDENGEGLDQKRYGYEVFVNDILYTFSGSLYDIDHDFTLIPYNGFEYNYDFYLSTETVYDETDWSVADKNIVMEVSMKDEALDVQKIGVRSVYTDGNGNTTYSAIMTPNGESGTEIIVRDNEPARYFNLQGVEVSEPAEGIYIRIQNGKASKVYVK